MSTASKVTLGLSIVFTTSIVYYVHYKQTKDREELRLGIVRDLERQKSKLAEDGSDSQPQMSNKNTV